MRNESVNPVQVETLEYVTRHMGDLRSMRVAPLLILLLVWFKCFYRHQFRVEGLIAFIICMAAAWLGGAAIERYYRNRYGEVHPSRPVYGTSGLTHLAIYSAPEQAVPVTAEQPGATIILVGVIACGLLTSIIDTAKPHPHLLGTFTFFWAAIRSLLPRLSAPTPALPALQVRRWLTLFMVTLFFALEMAFHLGSLAFPAYLDLMAGSALLLVAYDHWLLGHLLPRREPAHD